MKRLYMVLSVFSLALCSLFPATHISGPIVDGSAAELDITLELGSLTGSFLSGIMDSNLPQSLSDAALLTSDNMLNSGKSLTGTDSVGYAEIDGLYFFYYACYPNDITIKLYADDKMYDSNQEGSIEWNVSLGDKKNNDCNIYGTGSADITGDANMVIFTHSADDNIASYTLYPLVIKTTESYLAKPVETYTGSLHIEIESEGN